MYHQTKLKTFLINTVLKVFITGEHIQKRLYKRMKQKRCIRIVVCGEI